MKLELWLINRQDPAKKQKFDVELPVIPREGEVILVGDAENYEVSTIAYLFDVEGRFTGRITVDALSLWNCSDKK